MSYYVRIRGKAFGPFDQAQIEEMKSQGKISRTTEISEDRVGWYSAADVDFLFPKSVELPSPPEIRPAHGTAPHSSSEPTVWLYSVDGNAGYGPVSATKINELFVTRVLTENSLVWREGENARYLREVREFAGLSRTRKTTKKNASGSFWGWLLDFRFNNLQFQPTNFLYFQRVELLLIQSTYAIFFILAILSCIGNTLWVIFLVAGVIAADAPVSIVIGCIFGVVVGLPVLYCITLYFLVVIRVWLEFWLVCVDWVVTARKAAQLSIAKETP